MAGDVIVGALDEGPGKKSFARWAAAIWLAIDVLVVLSYAGLAWYYLVKWAQLSGEKEVELHVPDMPDNLAGVLIWLSGILIAGYIGNRVTAAWKGNGK